MRGGIRHSLGFINPNVLGLTVLAFICALFCTNYEIKYKTMVCYLFIAVVFYYISGCRSLLIGSIFLFIFYYATLKLSYICKKVLILNFPIFVIFFLMFLYQFSYGEIENELDEVFTHRFSIVSQVMQQLPLTSFGDSAYFNNINHAFDNSYAWYILNCGFIGTLLFIAILFSGLWVNINSTILISAGLTICLIGSVESIMYDVMLAFPLIKIIYDGINCIKIKT